MKKFAVLSVCFAFIFCVSFSSSATASDEEDIMQVAENWFNAFNSNDYELMDSLWWHSPKLTTFGPGGTFLNQGWEEEGWKSTLDVQAGTFNHTLHHPQITILTDDVAIITGYNSMVYTDPITKTQSSSNIRGTFVVQKLNGKWVIVHEHSSMLPTE